MNQFNSAISFSLHAKLPLAALCDSVTVYTVLLQHSSEGFHYNSFLSKGCDNTDTGISVLAD